ncbi:iron-siderophore ABC transporter substrate-binding protein [Starkeya nomas]|uniref:iron-siderophore ABC transporter substrate-binding protein n=1 Tax=Starkeya nomas TaxID=2666134 RepID=UPI001357DA68|nr:iron-siderophore ABC transporter substrate-binding protein [Starkeya nomas]
MSVPRAIGRRSVLAAALALAAGGVRAQGLASPRAATLDWAILETLLALGHPPVAATELVQFREVAVEPPVPPGMADLGLRGLPNLETLLLARPDIIFNSNFYAALEPRLARIAPVESFALYMPGQAPYEPMLAMTRAIAARLGIPGAAEALIARTQASLDAQRERLTAVQRPVLAINFGDARHFRTFGFDSMIGEALARLGLANAWSGPTSYSATAPVGIETLARYPDTFVAAVAPHPPDAVAVFERSAFWHALPAVKAGRVLWLGSVDPFGALPSASRFARLLTEALVRAEGAGRG